MVLHQAPLLELAIVDVSDIDRHVQRSRTDTNADGDTWITVDVQRGIY